MPVQPQLVLLQKTLLNIEGLGRQLYPQLDLWETAKPFLEKWTREQIGPRAAARTLKRELPNLFTLAPELPGLVHQILYRLKNDALIVRTRDQEIADLARRLASGQRRIARSVIGVGLLLAAVLLMNGGFTAAPWLSALLLLAAGGALLSAWFGGR